MPRPPMASQAQTLPLGRRLWLTLGSLGFGALNLRFFAELWPHTPVARLWLLGLVWLLLLTLPLQLVGWVWRWLRAYAGPGWVWLLAAAGFLGGRVFRSTSLGNVAGSRSRGVDMVLKS